MRREISHEELEEFYYKLKCLLREENKLIRELLELKKRRRKIKELLEKHIENVVNDFRNLGK
jgi:hypothetical protein